MPIFQSSKKKIEELELELRNKENDLRNFQLYFQEFSQFLPLAVVNTSPTGDIISANQACSLLSGFSEQDLLMKKYDVLFIEKNTAENLFRHLTSRQTMYQLEMTLAGKNGKDIPVLVSGGVRKDLRGNLIGLFFAIADITLNKEIEKRLEQMVAERTKQLKRAKDDLEIQLSETKKAKQEVELERNKSRATLRGLNEGIIAFDTDERIIYANPTAEKFLALNSLEILGKKIPDIETSPNLALLFKTIGKSLRATEKSFEFVTEKPRKKIFRISLPAISVKEEAVGHIVVLHDITRDREIDRLRKEFVTISAHQFRTPMSAIRGYSEMLLTGDYGKLSDKQEKPMTQILKSSVRMVNLVNDLLNVAEIEEGNIINLSSDEPLSSFIEEAVKSLSDLSEKHEVKLIFNEGKEKIPRIRIDGRKMTEVIVNILENAILYSKPGGKVYLKLDVFEKEIKFFCVDEGIGIPKDQQGRIFEKFSRADNAVKCEPDGNGLGLFMCKVIIKAHGGKIGFESTADRGTTFWFTIPRR